MYADSPYTYEFFPLRDASILQQLSIKELAFPHLSGKSSCKFTIPFRQVERTCANAPGYSACKLTSARRRKARHDGIPSAAESHLRPHDPEIAQAKVASRSQVRARPQDRRERRRRQRTSSAIQHAGHQRPTHVQELPLTLLEPPTNPRQDAPLADGRAGRRRQSLGLCPACENSRLTNLQT